MLSQPTLFGTVKATCLRADRFDPRRHQLPVFAKLIEEVGEFSEEVMASCGVMGKTPGRDGLAGEAVDVIITVLDILHVVMPGITEEDLVRIAEKKGAKWISHIDGAVRKNV